MKKNIKNNIIGFLVGAIVFSGITAYATIKISANEIEYAEDTVETALNNLYTTQNVTIPNLTSAIATLENTNKIGFATSSWKQSTGWNNSGLSAQHFIDTSYFSFASKILTAKKACKLKITATMINAGTTTSAPQYKLYRNNAAIISLTNTTDSSASKTNTITITVSAGDTFYGQIYGGASSSTYYVTTFEVINS